MDVTARNGQFAVFTQRRDDSTLISLGGELDLSEVPALERVLTEAVAGDHVSSVVDLSGLTFIDCAALRSLLIAQEKAVLRGHLLTFGRASGIVQKVFELTGHGASVGMLDGTAPEVSSSGTNGFKMAGELSR